MKKSKISGTELFLHDAARASLKLHDAAKNAVDEVKRDVKAVRDRDPAAKNDFEALVLYPGVHAIWAHRISHALYRRGWYTTARAVSQASRFFTGIEIHPAAKIGRRLFIDHGMGVVIGETTEIGDDCTLYQCCTLGGTGKECGKRHPTLGNGVMVGAGAKVLGAITVGDNAKIAAGAVVLKNVPADSTAVGIPARTVRRNGERVNDSLDHVHVPDPVASKIRTLEAEISSLRRRIDELEGESKNK